MSLPGMLDDRVRAVLERLEAEAPRPPGVPVEPTTGRFLFSVCAPQADCEVLEIGGGRGYSTIWLAAGVRNLGGRVLSLERDHTCIADWRRNIADAGLEETAELVEGDARETLPMIEDGFDVVFLDAANKLYEELFQLAREKLEPGALVIADDVVLHADTLAAYSQARQADPALSSLTVPLDRGLELSVVLAEVAGNLDEPRKGGGPVVKSSSTGSGGTSG
jgi:predicted O-methyltransferase YrrM